MKKTPYLRLHSRSRALERYDLSLNREHLREIVQQIQLGKAAFISRTSNSRTLWKIRVGNTLCNVVYDKRRKEIVTFLPPEIREETIHACRGDVS